MELLLLISIICLNVSLLLIWFKSEAFITWMKLFGLGKVIKYQEYLDTKLDNFSITYPLFLKLKYPNFIFKLIGCRLCLTVWLSLLSAMIFSKFYTESILNWITLTIFFCPIILVLSLYIYGVLSKQLNEN